MDSPVITGEGSLASVFDVTGFATSALASVAIAAARLSSLHGGTNGPITVDRRLASLWMATTAVPIGWDPPAAWDDLAGDYRTCDGWIRLHTNAATHRKAALSVLQCGPTREAVTAVIQSWAGNDLETAIHSGGGVAGVMRSAAEWNQHAQGIAVSGETLVHRRSALDGSISTGSTGSVGIANRRSSTVSRPLAGVRVLDLTKVLAGPVATRFPALLGADVIRVDSPSWAEPGVSHDTTVGKRCVHIDARTEQGCKAVQDLFETADVFVHGYRPGALKSIGLGDAARQVLNPGIIDVSLNAYGHTGPWMDRRAFDSVVQMSCGIAYAGMVHAGMVHFKQPNPTPLPVQALDHITGYLMAAAAMNGWADKLETGFGSIHQTSLARTALELMSRPASDPNGTVRAIDTSRDSTDFFPVIEKTSWGPLRRLVPPFTVPGVTLRWNRPAAQLGEHHPPISWLTPD